MRVLQEPQISKEEPCPYLDNRASKQQFFFALDVKKEEFEFLLEKGWRKFGLFYFKPECDNCRKCIPLRVLVDQFQIKKSHRRILKKNSDLTIKIRPLKYRDEIYDLYVKHSKERFVDTPYASKEFFIDTHFISSTASNMMEYWLDDKLIACGFLDYSHISLSSVYFIYDPDFKKRSLGIFGVLKELELASEQQLKYYYLGYWIKENSFMNYKSQFHPFEIFDWKSGIWKEIGKELI
ncbi:arginyltransferase [Halobacteriovorax sp. GB3]|uniref:arginyltransferase n=1 Tax=Halobacteriovorax sp. GB3 TaxID=2719615 RepID=UPI00235DD659|nr:arginyltransferase [Halobacteriovorax sp. GB3]MDD0853471.1 arginyltransferase [Halobacteriovorax sp. GB3]